MSGHSKWHSIKHKKSSGLTPSAGKMFHEADQGKSRSLRGWGGGDPEANARLRKAISGRQGDETCPPTTSNVRS